MLYTVKLHNVTCPLYLRNAGKRSQFSQFITFSVPITIPKGILMEVEKVIFNGSWEGHYKTHLEEEMATERQDNFEKTKIITEVFFFFF